MIHFLAILIDTKSLPKANTNSFAPILNILFVVLGAMALLMVVIGGFRYVISGGEPNKVAESKRMIIYPLVGLVVIALAATIVNFVLDKL